MSARGLAGRADLLRAAVTIAVSDTRRTDDEEALHADLAPYARLLHFTRQPSAPPPLPALPPLERPPSDETPPGEDDADTSRPPARTQADVRPPPLSAAHFALVAYHVDAETEPAGETPQPLTWQDCQPRQTGRAPHAPLVRRNRLWPALQRSLAVPRPGAPDVPALVGELARGRSPQRLPRQRVHGWSGEIHVIIDLAQRLLPYDDDYRALFAEVRRRQGRDGLRRWLTDDSPFAVRAVDVIGHRSPSTARGRSPGCRCRRRWCRPKRCAIARCTA
ncbi:MAG TPA: hypothetical protein PK981_01905 [Accumulibacter sp.]|nr:hypothetical protein [Accumulibacter sp.]HNG37783.1 hypothetical protein [Accumulibacter sp.]